jgi:diaminohydroxyphosphoribosylaminopyrimidine deaminase/5-amino-6-(5-phosphoribosylamino)uracil reductase
VKIRKNRPFFTWKVAATLDGKVAAADGTSKWITNEGHHGPMLRMHAAVRQMQFL